MKKISFICICLVAMASTSRADNWDLGQNSLTVGIGDVDWTISPVFHGTKLLLGGRYVFVREPATAYEEPEAEIQD